MVVSATPVRCSALEAGLHVAHIALAIERGVARSVGVDWKHTSLRQAVDLTMCDTLQLCHLAGSQQRWLTQYVSP